MDNIIELKKVNKFYGVQIRTQVLFDVDLSFEKESFNSIIGASGSGKSTLLNILGTLDRPTSGDVIINGVNTNELDKDIIASLRNETIGFVFQFHYLLPEFTALENVLIPLRIKNKRIDKKMLDKANEIMELVKLSSVKSNLANNMSGGQQQRTAIARALINDPKIVLADEPTGNLDSESTENVYSILRNINEAYKTTFVIITHDRRIAEKADRVIEMKDGRVDLDLKKS